MKRDEHGEYDPDAGSPHPVEEDEVGYQPCNAVLKFTFERYGERRYCTAMAIQNFADGGNDGGYKNYDRCKHHQVRDELMKQAAEQFKTGAHAKSHQHIFQKMPTHKQIIANDLYKSLVDESEYDFDMETVEIDIDVSDEDFAPDADTLVLHHPVPDDKAMRAKALWFAALDFITMESIREEQFRVALEESFEGRDLAVGERTKVVTVTEDGRTIEDVDEHHLNLPLSRIQSDYEKHLTFGGVDTDDDDEVTTQREWVPVYEPDPAPEADAGPSSPLTSVRPDEDIEAVGDDDE